MKKDAEIQEPTSCLNQSTGDEPLFVLCARDPMAPALVRSWAASYHALKTQEAIAPLREQVDVSFVRTPELTDAQTAKHAEARQIADDMEQWLATRGAK